MNNGYIHALPAPRCLGSHQTKGGFGTVGHQVTVHTGENRAANAIISGVSNTDPLDKTGVGEPGCQYMVLEFKVNEPTKQQIKGVKWDDVLPFTPRLHAPNLRELAHHMRTYRCHPLIVDHYKTFAAFYDFIWVLAKELPVAAATANLRWQHPAVQQRAIASVTGQLGGTVTRPDGAVENLYTDDTVSIPTEDGETVSIRQSALLHIAAEIIIEHQRLEQP